MNSQFTLLVRRFVLVIMWLLPIAGIYLFSLNRGTVVPANWALNAGARNTFLDWINQIAFSLLYILPTSLLGWMILRRHPQHRIGWILLFAGLAVAVWEFFEEATVYAVFTRAIGGPWIDGLLIIQNFIWVFNFTFLFLLISFFPAGDMPSGRWRWVFYLILFFTVLAIGGSSIESPMSSSFGLPNPLHIDFPGKQLIYNVWFNASVFGGLGAALGVLALSVYRYRRAKGDERQQFKWLAACVFFAVLLLSLGLLLGIGFQLTYGQLLTNYSLDFIPIGVGFAVLRYRLYDVDLIIRRTLVYTTLTGVLALIYFGGVTLLGGMLSAVSRQQSAIAIVISTLAIAALFNPLRRRVQDFIDRKFYRRKYDAEQTLEAFSASLREQVELEQLSKQLIDVIDETVRPEHSSLWMRRLPFERFDEPTQVRINRSYTD